MSVRIIEVFQGLVPEILCYEGDTKRIQREVREKYIGCRTYVNVPGSCINFLESLGTKVIELVEKGVSEVEETNYTKALQLSYLLLVPRIAEKATIAIDRRARRTIYRIEFHRRLTTEIPRTNLLISQIVSAIIRAHILDPSRPLSKLFLAWLYSKDVFIQYEHLEKDAALMLECIENIRIKNLDTGWVCLLIPCTCHDFKPINNGVGRMSKDIVTSIRVLSIATIPLLCFVLGGVAAVTKSSIVPITDMQRKISKGLKKFYEFLYGAPLPKVSLILKDVLNILYEELDRDKIIEVLQNSTIESLKLTAYLMDTL